MAVPKLPPPPIDDFDRKVLADRGVPLPVAVRSRLRTDRGELIIPYPDPGTGIFTDYVLRRPHTPPVWDGKPAKYIAPAGRPGRAYLPPDARAAALDPTAPMSVTEGPIKALAMTAAGFPAVGLLGVWNGNKKGTADLIPDLAALPWAGRSV